MTTAAGRGIQVVITHTCNPRPTQEVRAVMPSPCDASRPQPSWFFMFFPHFLDFKIKFLEGLSTMGIEVQFFFASVSLSVGNT